MKLTGVRTNDVGSTQTSFQSHYQEAHFTFVKFSWKTFQNMISLSCIYIALKKYEACTLSNNVTCATNV